MADELDAALEAFLNNTTSLDTEKDRTPSAREIAKRKRAAARAREVRKTYSPSASKTPKEPESFDTGLF